MIPQTFNLARYRFTLTPRGPMHLPPYKGSTLRGGFGMAFKETVCFQPRVKTCEGCLLRWQCPYPTVFEPAPPPDSEVLRTHTDIPTAFVIEPPLDDRREYAAGDTLTFNVVLIARAVDLLAYFVIAFQELGRRRGLTPDRVKFDVASVTTVNPFTGQEQSVYTADQPGVIVKRSGITASDIMGATDGLPADHLTLNFLTPTRLKYNGRFLHQAPPFHVIIRTLLRRVSSLSYFHAGHQWETDYRGWIARAKQVEITTAHVSWMDWQRYSTRQQRHMNLGGIVGQVTYSGEIAPFLPLLRLGELIHVGKGAVFGNGQYRLESDSDSDSDSDREN